MSIYHRLQELGIYLESPSAAVANYIPATTIGNLIFVSGQLPFQNRQVLYKGKIGKEYPLSEAQEAARLCALNILSHLNVACKEDLDRVKACIRLGGFINCEPDFEAHPLVMNGASNLMVDVFGQAGKHTRTAVGVSSLPLGAAVEIEALFELKE